MLCDCLKRLERALLENEIRETARGELWSEDCREWAYFDCVLDLVKLRERFGLPGHVSDHEHRGTHDGSEKGFYCQNHKDGVMGLHPDTPNSASALHFSGLDQGA